MKDELMAVIGVNGKDYLKTVKLLRENKISYKHDLGFYFQNKENPQIETHNKKSNKNLANQ
jgi:hypothetical protein